MKFIIFVAFLVFSPQVAEAAKDCSTVKDYAGRHKCWLEGIRQKDQKDPRSCKGEFADQVLTFIPTFQEAGLLHKVDHEGAYVFRNVWAAVGLEDKELAGRVFAAYQGCYVFGMDKWVPAIKILDYYSGKEIGRLSAWSGTYKEK